MKGIVWRVKKGWVYLVGIALMVGFSALAYGEIDVKTAKENREAPKQEEQKNEGMAVSGVKGAITAANEAPKSTTTTKPEEKKTKTKTVYKTVTVDQTKSVTSTPSVAASTTTKPPVKKDMVKLVISGLGTYEVEIKKGDSALTALQRAGTENGFVVGLTHYSFGDMVTKIGSKEAQGTYYWALYYEGGYASVGAGDLIIKNKDIIEWRYESW